MLTGHIQHKTGYFNTDINLTANKSFFFCLYVDNFRNILKYVYFNGYGKFRKINYGDICLLILRDMGYLSVYFQGYGILYRRPYHHTSLIGLGNTWTQNRNALVRLRRLASFLLNTVPIDYNFTYIMKTRLFKYTENFTTKN